MSIPDMTLELPSPGKINLFLHINNKRPDGYHNLQTIFQYIEHCDTLTFTATTNGKIEFDCELATLNHDANLVMKAANLLKLYADNQWGVKIQLHKILPIGGGVGGGSSNAATTLLALNYLWQLNLSIPELAKIAVTLGADVPFFIFGQSVFAGGIGDIFTPVQPPEQWLLLAIPPCQISTASIFNHPDLPRNTPSLPPKLYNLEQTNNDCQTLVKKLYPEVANTITRLLKYAPTRLTGTGSCIFSVFECKKSCEQALACLPLGVKGIVTKGQNSSATHQALRKIININGES